MHIYKHTLRVRKWRNTKLIIWMSSLFQEKDTTNVKPHILLRPIPLPYISQNEAVESVTKQYFRISIVFTFRVFSAWPISLENWNYFHTSVILLIRIENMHRDYLTAIHQQYRHSFGFLHEELKSLIERFNWIEAPIAIIINFWDNIVFLKYNLYIYIYIYNLYIYFK